MDEPVVRREDGELESSSSEAEDQEQLEDDSFLTAHEEEASTPGRYKQPRRSTRKSERSVSSLPESEIDRIISEVNNQAKNGACLSSSDTSLFPDSTAPSVSANSTILPGSVSNMSVPLVDSAVVDNNAEHGQENTSTDNMDDNAIRHMLLESIIKRRKKDKEEGEVSDADDENGRSPNNDLQPGRFEKKTDGSKELRKKAAKTRHRRHSESRGEKEPYRRGGHPQASSRSARGRERYRERDRRRHSSRSAERSKYDRSPRMSRSRKSSSSTPQPSTLKNLLEGLKPPWIPPPPPSSSPAYSDRSEDNRIIVSEDSSENIILKEVREDYRHNDRSSGDHSRKRRKHSRSKNSRLQQAYTDMVLGISSANNISNTTALDIDVDQNTSGNSGNISSISPPDAEERPASASANVPFCFTWKGNQQSQQQISPSILGAQILPLSPYGSLRRSTESQPPEVFQHSVFQRHQPQQPLTFMGRTVQPTSCHGTVPAPNGFRTASIAASGPSGGDNYDNVHMDMDSDSGTPDAGQRTPLNLASSSNRKRLSSDFDETKLRQMLLNQVETKRNSAPNSEDVGSESDILVTPPQSTSEKSQQQNGRSSAAPNYSINRAMKASPNVPVERTFPQKPGSRINGACILTPSPIISRKRPRKRKAAHNKNKQHSNMEDVGDEVITTRASYQQALKAINVVGVQLDKETAIVEKNVKKRKQLKAELEQCSSLLDRHHAAYTMLFKKRENLLKRVQDYERIKIEEIAEADSPTPSTSKRSRRVVDDDSDEEYEEEEIDVGVETDQEEEGESEYDMIEEDVEPEQDEGDNEEDRDDEEESNEDGSATPQVEEEMRMKLLEKQRSRQEKHRDILSRQRSPAPECSIKDAGGVRVKEELSSPVELEETFYIVLPERSINKEMCPYDINGRCKNSKCKWQHTSDMVKKDRQIIEAILQIEPNLMAPGQSVEALLAMKEREESFGEFVQRITNHLPVFRKRMIQLKINLLG